MLRKKPGLHLEHLEVRDTPAAFSVSWGDALHLKVSYDANASVATTGMIDLSSHQAVNGLSASAVQSSVIQAIENWNSQSTLIVDFMMVNFNAPPANSGQLGAASSANFSTELGVNQGGAVTYIGIPPIDPATNPSSGTGTAPPDHSFPYQDFGKWWLDYVHRFSA